MLAAHYHENHRLEGDDRVFILLSLATDTNFTFRLMPFDFISLLPLVSNKYSVRVRSSTGEKVFGHFYSIGRSRIFSTREFNCTDVTTNWSSTYIWKLLREEDVLLSSVSVQSLYIKPNEYSFLHDEPCQQMIPFVGNRVWCMLSTQKYL